MFLVSPPLPPRAAPHAQRQVDSTCNVALSDFEQSRAPPAPPGPALHPQGGCCQGGPISQVPLACTGGSCSGT
eukprot:2149183-Alexandrium_andersonii.AAC.1